MRPLLALALLLPAAARPAALTLDEALAEAARANADLKLARAQADSAGVDVYASWSGVLPRLDLTAAFGHDFLGQQTFVTAAPVGLDPVSGQPIFRQEAISIPSADFPDYSFGLTFQWPLFDGMRSWNGVARSRAAARAADRDVDEAGLSVAFEVTRRFYEVVKAEESLRVLEETVTRSEDLVGRAEALFSAGRGPKSDVWAARVNLQNDRMAVESQRARLAQARSDLAVILGRDSDPELSVVPPPALTGPGLPSAGEPPSDGALLERARRRRPLLASRAEAVHAADLDVSVARGAWWPVVGVQATYNRLGPIFAGLEGIYGDPGRQFTANAQVYVQWNLFNGRQTQAGVERAEVAARRARLQAEQADQQVSSEIVHARSSVVALARSAALAQDGLSAAEQGLALARQRFDAGAASQLEVRDASLKLTQAKLALVNTRVDYLVARADLSRALGGVF